MNRVFAGFFVFIISCSGIYLGCEKKTSKIEVAQTQGATNSQTKQFVTPNTSVPGQSGKKFGPFDIGHKHITVTYDYGDAITGDSLEIKDATGVSYLKETYHNDGESSYTVENAFKVEGKSGEGIIIFYDLEPNAPPCGPEFQIFGMEGGSLKSLSSSIIVCGQFEKLPEGTPSGVLKLLDGDLIKVEVWKGFFGIRIPFKVDFQKMTIAPLMARGVFDINIPHSIDSIDTSEGNEISFYPDHTGNSIPEVISASEIKKVEFIGSYADVHLEQVSKSQLDIKITNIWLKVKVNGREGWVNDTNDFYILGLVPLG